MKSAAQTILVVDDRQPNRAYLSAILGSRGYTTYEAEDGAKALELLANGHPPSVHRSSSIDKPRIDLVLADILMPRMDGYEFVQHVRTTPSIASTPIILLTAHYKPSEAASLAASYGVDRIIAKPVEPEVLLEAVDRSLQGAGRHASTPGPGLDRAHLPLRRQETGAFDEEHRRLLTDTLARKATQLEVANDCLHGLVKLGRRLALERDPRQLLSLFITSAGDLLGSEYALLVIAEWPQLDAKGQNDVPQRPLLVNQEVPIKHILASGRDGTIVGNISSTGVVREMLVAHADAEAPIFIADTESAIRAGALPAALRPLAPGVFLAPIATASRRYGIMVFGGMPIAADRDRLTSLVQSMGGVLGVAYENATRYEQIERHAAQLQSEIAERIAAEERIARLNAELEQRVAERTAELERSYGRLRQSERMASLGTLCAGLGHDMGNLLLPIRMRLDIIEQSFRSHDQREGEHAATEVEAATTSELLENVGSIRECIQYISDLTSGLRLLSLNPDEAGPGAAVTNLAEWWQCVRPLMRSALPASIQLDAAFPQEPVSVAIAQHRLTQAVFNLVQNAGDAMVAAERRNESGESSEDDRTAEIGRVIVAARVVDDPVAGSVEHGGGSLDAPEVDIEVRGSRADAGQIVQLAVTDNGPGMSENVRRRAVEPFYTTKARALSTGLGLSLVHGIIKSAGGSVDIDTEPGRGTSIKLTLPIVREDLEAGRQDIDRPCAFVSIEQSRRRALARSMLEVLGYRVTELVHGEPRIIDEDASSPGDPAVWVADAGAATLDQVHRFMSGGDGRRIAVLGSCDDLADLPGCAILEPDLSLTALRRELRRLFRRRDVERSTEQEKCAS